MPKRTSRREFFQVAGGAAAGLMLLLNWGNGRIDWRTVWPPLYPEYGRITPRCASVVFCPGWRLPTRAINSARSAVFPTLKPYLVNRSSLMSL